MCVCINIYTGCIKKKVIELWRAIGHSIFNIQNNSCVVGKIRLLALDCHYYCKI